MTQIDQQQQSNSIDRTTPPESPMRPESPVPSESPESPCDSSDTELVTELPCRVKGCNKTFKHRKNIKRHVMDYHGSLCPNGQFRRKRVLCLNCDKVVLNKSNLDIHHKLKHKNLAKNSKPINQISNNRMNGWKNEI